MKYQVVTKDGRLWGVYGNEKAARYWAAYIGGRWYPV